MIRYALLKKCTMKLFSRSKKRSDDESASTANSSGGGGLFARLARTRDGLFGGITSLFSGDPVDESMLEEIEDHLLVADVGVAVAEKIVNRLRVDAASAKQGGQQQLLQSLREVMLEIVQPCDPEDLIMPEARPMVIMMVGVNGVGKTTTLAKIAARYKHSGSRVMLAACDTFRAAAIEQLQNWGERLEVPVIAQAHGADAAAVAFDAFSAAKARACELLLVDTAGRQHTHGDLVEQLVKVKRVLAKADSGIPDQIWLTVDAGNGQNVLSQVQHFDQAVGLTGLCITKLDGTAKGGVVLALADRFGLPIRYIGTGESAEDLRQFDAAEFVDALLPTVS